MILNDPEWLEWPFFVNFSLLRTDFDSYYLHLFTVESVHFMYTRDQRRCAETE